MLKFYAEFTMKAEVPGLWGEHIGTTTKTVELSKRDIGEALAVKPDEAYVFRLFNQNEVKCDDGEVVHGQKKDWSPVYYLGKGPCSKEDLLATEQAEEYAEKIKLLEDTHDYQELQVSQEAKQGKEFPDYFVITDDGNLHPLHEGEAVISSQINS